jgi:hypothetical protein
MPRDCAAGLAVVGAGDGAAGGAGGGDNAALVTVGGIRFMIGVWAVSAGLLKYQTNSPIRATPKTARSVKSAMLFSRAS